MADGAKYRVRQRYQVAVGRTSVVVFDDKDLAHILPLLIMTGIMYRKPNSRHYSVACEAPGNCACRCYFCCSRLRARWILLTTQS